MENNNYDANFASSTQICALKSSNLKSNSPKRSWRIITLFLLLYAMGGVSCSLKGNGANNPSHRGETGSLTEKESVSAANEIEFLNQMYKDFFDNKDFDTEKRENLLKYLSPEVADKILFECPYEGSEGEKSYEVFFFADGRLGYERPDYGDKVVSRTIKAEQENWFEVTNIWDAISDPVKVKLRVEKVNGNYKVTDVATVDENMISTNEFKAEKKKNDETLISIEVEYPIDGNQETVDVLRKWIVENLNFHTDITYAGSHDDANGIVNYYCNKYINDEGKDETMCQIDISKAYETSNYVTYMSTGCSGGASQWYWTQFLTLNKYTDTKVKHDDLFVGNRKELIKTICKYAKEDDLVDDEESELIDAMLTPEKATCVLSGYHGGWAIDVPTSAIKKFLSEEGKAIIDQDAD